MRRYLVRVVISSWIATLVGWLLVWFFHITNPAIYLLIGLIFGILTSQMGSPSRKEPKKPRLACHPC